jgi:Flp pilus assembly protein TadD
MVEPPTPSEIQRNLTSLGKKLEVLNTDRAAIAERIMKEPGILRALGITEDEVKALSVRAFGVMQAGNYVQAEEGFSLLAMLVPHHPYFWQGWGVACLLRDKVDEAEKYIRKSIDLAPEEPSYHVNLGEVLYRKGDAPGAFAAFQKAEALDPEHKDLLVNRARAILGMATMIANNPELRDAMEEELKKQNEPKAATKEEPSKKIGKAPKSAKRK